MHIHPPPSPAPPLQVEAVVSDLESAKIDLQTTIDNLQTAQQDIVTAQQAADEAAKVAKAADATAGGKAAGGTFWTASLYAALLTHPLRFPFKSSLLSVHEYSFYADIRNILINASHS